MADVKTIVDAMDESKDDQLKKSFEVKQVTETQLVCNFARYCGLGRGKDWNGLIVMPTSQILVYVRNILEDLLYLQIDIGDVEINMTASSTIVVKWQSGETLRLEACHCAKSLHHLRGCHYQFVGFVHPQGLSERTALVARLLLRPYNNEPEVIYEA
ncbi:hypothetical protein [Escherichia phage Skure]|nr:hypothetical protein [Escherichia phage Skure]